MSYWLIGHLPCFSPIIHISFITQSVLSPACSTVAPWMMPHIDLMVASWSGCSLFGSLLPVGWHIWARSPVLMDIPLLVNFVCALTLWVIGGVLGEHTLQAGDSAWSTSHPVLPSCAAWPLFPLSSSASEFLEGDKVPSQKRLHSLVSFVDRGG